MIQSRPWIRWIERGTEQRKQYGGKMILRRRRKLESRNNTERNDLVRLSVLTVIGCKEKRNMQGQNNCECQKTG